MIVVMTCAVVAEIVIAKHRNGAVGEVLLRFKGEFTRFSNPEDDDGGSRCR